MRTTVRERDVWLLSLFFFFHLGVGITSGGEHPPSYYWFPRVVIPVCTQLTTRRLSCRISRHCTQRNSCSSWPHFNRFLWWTCAWQTSACRTDVPLWWETYAPAVFVPLLGAAGRVLEVMSIMGFLLGTYFATVSEIIYIQLSAVYFYHGGGRKLSNITL